MIRIRNCELQITNYKTNDTRATIKVAPTVAFHSEIYSDIEITNDTRATIKVAPTVAFHSEINFLKRITNIYKRLYQNININ